MFRLSVDCGENRNTMFLLACNSANHVMQESFLKQKNMKTNAMIIIIMLSGLLTKAADQSVQMTEPLNLNSYKNVPFKKVDITVVVNGYTIHIVGNINYNVWNGNVSITATLTISGNGVNITVPYNYTGSLNQAKGKYEYAYDESKIAAEDRAAVRAIISHIHLPEDKNPKNVRVE